MAWTVDLHDDVEAWLIGLSRADQARVTRQLDKLRAGGPMLGRPTVDSVEGSRHRNMKELRVSRSPVRALFAFGPDRRAIVLLGGSKAGMGKRWYRAHMPVADRLFDEHLTQLGKEGTCRSARAGRRSAGRSA